MNRSELVITIVGLIATFCLPWPCTREPEVSAPHAQRLLAHLQQNDTASTPWAYTAFERARPRADAPASADALTRSCNRFEAAHPFLALDPGQGFLGGQRIGKNRALTQIDA